MGRPLGSKNKPKQQFEPSSGLVDMRQDDYVNAFTGMGTNRDRSSYTRASATDLLDQLVLETLYLGDGFARRVVDIPAEEMTRAGIYFDNLDDASTQVLQDAMVNLDIMAHMNDALRWSRAFGGALIVMGLNDAGALEEPLNEEAVKSIEFLRVYDRWQVTEQSRVSDPSDPDYGKVEVWLVTPAEGGSPYKVHYTRTLILDGDPIPARLRNGNQGWGASVFQGCYAQLKRLGASHQHANMLLERAQQPVHKIPGLSALLAKPGGDATVAKRVDIVDYVRGTLNTIAIDGMEDYEIKSPGVDAGVVTLLDRFAEALSAVTGIPVFLLMGKSATGMQGNSGTNEEAWYARVGAMQKDVLYKPLFRIVSLLASTIGTPEGWRMGFEPLAIQTDEQLAKTELTRAQVDKTFMETIDGFVAINAMDQEEARDQIKVKYGLKGDLPPLATPPIDTVAVKA